MNTNSNTPYIQIQASVDNPNTSELVANGSESFHLLVHMSSGPALIPSTQNGDYYGVAETIPADARVEAVQS